jgi:hypothetical protein
VHSYFPHFLDVEYSQRLGPPRAAGLVDHYLKLLALLGARVCIGDIILVDSESIQRLVADQQFLDFVRFDDPGFLRLEATTEGDSTQCQREQVARQAWRRMQADGWVSSSGLPTAAVVAAARTALDCGFDDVSERARFEAKIQQVVADFELSKAARTRLVNTFDLVSWFGSNPRAVARAKSPSPVTYYDKLMAALEAPHVKGADYAVLERVKRYIDSHVEKKWARSPVLKLLDADKSLDKGSKDEIRATVASAWTAAIADGFSAAVNLTVPLPWGVVIPRVLDEPKDAFVDPQQADDLIHHVLDLRVEDTIRIHMGQLSWGLVADLVKETEATRELVAGAVDEGREPEPDLMAAHRRALKQTIQKRYPALNKLQVGAVGISIVSAIASNAEPIGFLGVVASAMNPAQAAWKWTRGRFVAGTVNRFADQLGRGTRND